MESERNSVNPTRPGFDKHNMQIRRRRSRVMATCLFGLIVLFFLVTLVKLGFWD